ncbi:MAG: hypothetical protein S4CHLAM45_12390 [Chlamydiales bacterium]|nr:hypothetical protein [Chlamydiales bacterium]MCH9619728.1 hypothetical protein [Chlamydiales bacterium]MCH9623334.1 hypothetical protein [Chlamydiales bacterium]
MNEYKNIETKKWMAHLDPKGGKSVDRVNKTLKKESQYGIDLEKFLSKRFQSNHSEEEKKWLDEELLYLILSAPDGWLQGHLIHLGYLIPQGNADLLAEASESSFFKENPAHFHELAQKFNPSGDQKDLLVIRQILLYNRVFAQMLQLYLNKLDMVKGVEKVPSDIHKWLSDLYTQLDFIIAEIAINHPDAEVIRDQLALYQINLEKIS